MITLDTVTIFADSYSPESKKPGIYELRIKCNA
jgi:hypothetical protein